MVLAEALDPIRKSQRQFLANLGAALQFNGMALSVVKTDRFNVREPIERPRETGRRILSAGEKNECTIVVEFHVHSFNRRLRQQRNHVIFHSMGCSPANRQKASRRPAWRPWSACT